MLCYGILYNISYGMLYDICYGMLYNMVCIIYVMVCYVT